MESCVLELEAEALDRVEAGVARNELRPTSVQLNTRMMVAVRTRTRSTHHTEVASQRARSKAYRAKEQRRCRK